MDSNQHATTTVIIMLLLPHGRRTSHTFLESAILSSRLTQSRFCSSVRLSSSHCGNLVVGEFETIASFSPARGLVGRWSAFWWRRRFSRGDNIVDSQDH